MLLSEIQISQKFGLTLPGKKQKEIFVSEKAIFGLVLLIKVLLIKEKACRKLEIATELKKADM